MRPAPPLYTTEHIKTRSAAGRELPLCSRAVPGPYSLYRIDIASRSLSLLPPIPTNFRAATALPPLIRLDRRADVLLRAPAPSDPRPPQSARRSRIWELAETLHCWIIGTCLSNAELRHALARLGVNGIEAADDHELHVVGVILAGRRDAGAKMLQRALDRRHAVAIKQYAKARDEQALRQLWDESIAQRLRVHMGAAKSRRRDRDDRQEGVPGRAHAVASRRRRQPGGHPALAGAGGRKGALTEKSDRQQRQLRDGFTSRDETIRQLNALLARHAPAEGTSAIRESGQDDAESAGEETSRNVIADLKRKLGQEITRRERLEQRLSAMSATMKKTAAALKTAEGERDALRREIESLEDHIAALLSPPPATARRRPSLPPGLSSMSAAVPTRSRS